jgi:glycosyltransferase involved in cell wall biosynthesis
VKVSVAIPAYNAQKTIGQAAAQSLAQAKGSLEVEVIVVDDGSTDNTADVAASAGAQVIRQHNSGPASARNTGWKSAKGSLICFTDADCIPSPDWMINLLEGFTDMTVGAVAGSYDIANDNSWLARCVHQEIIERHSRMGSSIRAFGSYNVAIPRYVLEATGGFDPSYRTASGEDNDLSYRIIQKGWRIAFRPQAKVAHHHPERLWRYLKEQYRHGFWRAKLYKEHPNMISGDDYTRLRDKFEPILVLGITGFSVLALLGITSFVWPLFAILLAYACIHLAWPVRWWLGGGKAEALPYAGVTFLRGFARTIGLCAGILRFGLQLAYRDDRR